jgi:uncharacterized membrane protein YjjP (DUF1212 family)
MNYTDEQLKEAARNDIFSAEQVNKFREYVQNKNNQITKLQADIKFKKDYSFWLYLFGLITLSSGLSVFYNENLFKFIMLGVINVLLILFSLFINRNVFIVFGIIGVMEFLSRLSWEFFEGSVFFPFALTIIGVLLILSGIFFQKNRKSIEENFINKLPIFILNLRPKRNI